MELTTFLITISLVEAGLIIWLLLRKKEPIIDSNNIEEKVRLQVELDQKNIIVGKLENELENEKKERGELSGKNKQLFVEITSLKSSEKKLLEDKERLIKEVSDFKATEKLHEKEIHERIKQLDESKKALDDEKQRVRREDEEKLQREKEERNKIWSEHESRVQVILSELCKKPEYSFQYYDNKNLPSDFSGKFKPDSIVEFLDQYVIFDAKKSESDIQNYIKNQVKTTVDKVKDLQRVYRSIFFVIPTESIKLLKDFWYYEQGYEFFVISPEAIDVVLATFKKINSYEIAQQLDPIDRENIVNLISEFDYHINLRNALDILASKSGVTVLEKIKTLKDDIRKDVNMKKKEMRLQQFSPTDIRTLIADTETQKNKINELTSPKTPISKDDIEKVIPIITKRRKKDF